jgi:CBS domain-containing protein
MTRGKISSPLSGVLPEVNASIRYALERRFGVLDANFLSQSLSILEPRAAITVPENESIEAVLKVLRDNRVGCVLVTDAAGVLTGIFSERDCVLKVVENFESNKARPVSDFMTKDPIAEGPETSIAFALSLMSQGGFRHIPVISPDRHPVGMISVKDVVDFIVTSFMNDIMAFSPEHLE